MAKQTATQLFKAAIGILTFVLLPVSYNACGVKRPSVEMSSRVVAFNHALNLTSCAGCHEGKRPSPDHGNGQDCVGCHSPTGWAQVSGFTHNPKPSSCNSCHGSGGQADRTTKYLAIGQIAPPTSPYFLKNLYGGGHPNGSFLESAPGQLRDCSECHSPGANVARPTDWVEKIDLSSTFHGTANSGSCLECHSSSGNWDRQKFWNPKAPPSGTQAGGHPEMSLLSAKGANNCASCHQFTDQLLKEDWHQPSLTQTFHKYINASDMTSLSCNQCHGGTGQFNRMGFWTGNHPSVNTGSTDCNTCHTSKTVGIVGDPSRIVTEWKGNIYAGGTSHAEPPAISSCASCHDNTGNTNAGQRPTVAPKLKSPWTNIQADHFKNSSPSDCKSCHTTPPMNIADTSLKTWNVEKDAVGVVQTYNHKSDNAGTAANLSISCSTCHTGPTTLTLQLKNSKGTTGTLAVGHSSATSCDSCHVVGSTFRPSTHPSVTGKACTSCHTDQMPAGKTLLDGSVHISNLGSSDCTACHTSQVNWALATSGAPANITVGGFNGVPNLTLPHPTATSCAQCHANGTGPGKPANDYDHSPTPASCRACHETGTPFISKPTVNSRAGAPNPLTVNGIKVTATNHFSPTDCKKCHSTSGFKGWLESGHRSRLSGETAACNTCHGPIPK